MITKPILLVLVLCVAIAASVNADDKVVWEDSSLDEFEGPRHQLAVTVGLRTDETQRVDARPEVSVKYLRWFSRFAAITTDLGITNESIFNYRSSARTIALGAGLRLQEPGGFASIFFEPGLSLHRHSGDLNGVDFSETRFGLSISMGLSVEMFGKGYLDISLRQVLNAPGGRPIYVVTLPSPPIDEHWVGMGGADAYDLYNPTHLLVSYRFGL